MLLGRLSLCARAGREEVGEVGGGGKGEVGTVAEVEVEG